MGVESVIAEGVGRRYRTGRGVEDISLVTSAGQCLGVLGANGSGKTTLTRIVAGLDRADRGRLLVLGRPAYPRPADVRRRCGTALDTPAHWDALSGRQNLYFFARQHGLAEPHLTQRLDGLLDEAGLAGQADEPVADYSFGMRRKLSVLEALAHEPDLLILDEASAGADAAFLDRLTRWIQQRCERGKTTWVADNDPDWVSRTATHAVLLADGRMEAKGVVSELMVAVGASHRVDIVLEQAMSIETPNIPGVEEYRCHANRITAKLDGHPKLPAELMRWIVSHEGRVRTMEIRTVTLREALAQRAGHREISS